MIQDKKISDEELLLIIAKHKDENLTYRKLCKITGYKSTATLQKRIKRLELEGKVRKRNISIIEIVGEE